MKIYKCDGESYANNEKCENTTTQEIRVNSPKDWITIDVNRIENDLPENRLVACAKNMLHFCSKKCLNNYLFKDNTYTHA